MDWNAIFGVGTSLPELIVRGSVMYWFLFLVLRFAVRRDIGALAPADILLLVILADAAQNALSGGYSTITEGAVLIGTIVGWNVAIDWLAFRFPAFSRFAQAPPMLLIRNGRILHGNLRRQFLSESELRGQLRKQSIDDIGDVKRAYMEGDGKISVLTREKASGKNLPGKSNDDQTTGVV